jgi:hypothetical protein
MDQKQFLETVRPVETENVRDVRELDKKEIKCPAGVEFHHMATYKSCFCNISKSKVTSTGDPLSFNRFCTDDYQQCPVWAMRLEQQKSRR